MRRIKFFLRRIGKSFEPSITGIGASIELAENSSTTHKNWGMEHRPVEIEGEGHLLFDRHVRVGEKTPANRIVSFKLADRTNAFIPPICTHPAYRKNLDALSQAAIFASSNARSEKELMKFGRPVHTFSIVACDLNTGEMGVAVQSHWFSVGPIVPWAEPGVGAVATQSFVDPSYGPKGLDLMRTGKTASEALKELIAADSGEAVRQVAMVDITGRVAVHTGKRCIEYAGHKTGKGYSAQANIMLTDKVPAAMAKGFEETQGDLAERMLVALEAAQNVGGDIRGKQSAAMIVVKSESSGKPWMDRVVDLRIEDHSEPLKELRRLLNLARAYNHMNAGDAAMEKKDFARAMEEYREAMELAKDNVEIEFWSAFTLATNGKVRQALPIFKKVFKVDKNWMEVLKRLPKAGLITDDEAGRTLLRQILEEAT